MSGIDDKVDNIIKITSKTMEVWKNFSYGIAPDVVANIMSDSMLDWIVDMTKCLKLWTHCFFENAGELILAWVNLGSLAEAWLKFFFSVYYEDYMREPKKNRSGIIEPDKKEMKFELLIQKAREDTLWSKGDRYDLWLQDLQEKRNSIHIFSKKNIGDVFEYQESLDIYTDFVKVITERIPSLEDYIYDL